MAAMLSAMCSRYAGLTSQRPRVGFDIRAEERAETAGQQQVYPAVRQRLEFLGKAEIVAKPSFRVQVDQQIDVAVRPLLARSATI